MCSMGCGGPLPTVPESCGKPGEAGASGDSSDYFGKCPVLGRKEREAANLACERNKNEAPLEVWVPRDLSSGRPEAPAPKRNLGILNCRNVT